jgi:hypothetical protein
VLSHCHVLSGDMAGSVGTPDPDFLALNLVPFPSRFRLNTDRMSWVSTQLCVLFPYGYCACRQARQNSGWNIRRAENTAASSGLLVRHPSYRAGFAPKRPISGVGRWLGWGVFGVPIVCLRSVGFAITRIPLLVLIHITCIHARRWR